MDEKVLADADGQKFATTDSTIQSVTPGSTLAKAVVSHSTRCSPTMWQLMRKISA